MRTGSAILILLVILVFPSLFIFLGHCGEPKSEIARLKSYKIANPAGGQDSVFRTAGNFSFNCQFGYPVNQDTFKNHIWVANVFFTTCKATCPLIMRSMQFVQREFKNDPEVKFLSITVDPETDSVARLAFYSDSIKAVPGQWYMITGNIQEIYQFANQQMLFQAVKDEDSTIVAVHDSRVRVFDHKGRLRGTFPDATTDYGYTDIINEINQLKAERAAGQR